MPGQQLRNGRKSARREPPRTWSSRAVDVIIQRRVPFVWLAAIVSAALLGGWIWYAQTPQRVVARRIQQLESVPGDQVPDAVQDLVRLGQPGVAATVGLLRSERPEVRDAAKQSLRQELARWRMIDPYEATEKVGHLATELKAQIDQFAPPERDFAAELATEILLWPLQGETAGRLEIVRDCEDILRKSYEGRSQEESYAARDAEYDQLLDRLAAERLANSPSLDPSDNPKVSVPQSPGLLPIERVSDEVAFRADTPRPTVGNSELPPVRVDVEGRLKDFNSDSNEASPYETDRTSIRPTIPRKIDGLDADRLSPARSAEDEGAPIAQLAQPQRRQEEASPGNIDSNILSPITGTTSQGYPDDIPEVSASERERYRWWAHVDLMRHLHNRDREFAERCRTELENRGFTNQQIAISYEVTDPDPAIRRAAVDKLTRHVTFDPKPWLKLLCEDGNLQVRAAAISFLATSTNPADRRYVAELMDGEQNASLREQLNWR